MKRKFRLNRSTDIKRVRRLGKSYAHPLVVLIASPSELDCPRIGVVAGRSVGRAVVRNRAKRRIRSCVDGLLCRVAPGWDILLVARKPIANARYQDIEIAVEQVARRAGLIHHDG